VSVGPRPLRGILVACALVVPMAALIGAACALFLWSLQQVTLLFQRNPVLLWFLPLGGVAVVLAYQRKGRGTHRGTALIIDEIHQPGAGVPLRLAPLVLVGTLVTHLFGGSAGREGTAVQMGGALASWYERLLARFHRHGYTRTLLMAGVAAGFAGVFGTPWAGAVFAAEVLTFGRAGLWSFAPCLCAAFVADRACLAWGIHHTHYQIDASIGLDVPLLVKAAAAALAFGLAARLFKGAAHAIRASLKQSGMPGWVHPLLGGAAVIALTLLLGSRDYLGLGVSNLDPDSVTILSAFRPDGATDWSWLLKLIFTAVTVAGGFRGGEVTPLFFIGAALGNTIARHAGAPVDLFAGLGLIAVFAAAARTPLACTILGAELFGVGHWSWIILFLIACFGASLVGGSGLYLEGTALHAGRRAADPPKAP